MPKTSDAIEPCRATGEGRHANATKGDVVGPRMKRAWLLVPWLGLLLAASCNDDEAERRVDGETAEVVSCEGSCSCDPDTRTCTCQGGSLCETECDGPCTLQCEGNARCDMSCPDDCTIECPGTAGCDARVGDNAVGVCNGTGDCAFTCEGDCSFDCPGASRCVVFCAAGATCEITSCPMVTECDGDILACRTDCPSPPDGA